MIKSFQPDAASAGFTLVELLVSLTLFALISLAGVGLVETIIGVQQRTSGRVERLAEIQRALYLITADLEQVTAGPTLGSDGVALTRGSGDGDYSVSYRLQSDVLYRAARGEQRPILSGTAALRWRFLKGETWTDLPVTREAPERPRAVEMTVELAKTSRGLNGSLRRVIDLPVEP